VDTFNRGLVLALAVLVAAAGLILFAVVIGLLPASIAEGAFGDLSALNRPERVAAALACLLITSGAAGLVALELHDRRREVTTRTSDGFRYGISRDSISHVVQEMCAELTGIEAVQSRVTGSGRGLSIDCVARLQPRFNPVEVSQRLRYQVKQSVEATIGIPVREISVHVEPPAGVAPMGGYS
jgi:hypothetical protein